ncbi:MAG: hypothetical protein MHMPM18_003183 [Marteilia pararefringens]
MPIADPRENAPSLREKLAKSYDALFGFLGFLARYLYVPTIAFMGLMKNSPEGMPSLKFSNLFFS